ncbi:hypothetical protein K2M58_09125 [Hydrogenibacillus sp. N12]|nr:hypothetical protein K2M58_09125 [Hydrogenibacillus sp. N12]
MTDRAMAMLFGHLRDRSFRRVAEEANLSPGTIRRLLLRGVRFRRTSRRSLRILRRSS